MPPAGRLVRVDRLPGACLAAVLGLVLTVLPSSAARAQSPEPGPDLAAPHAAYPLPSMGSPLSDVRVEGNETIVTSTIARHIKTRPGRAPDERQIREDVRQLYATRWFLSVEPRFRQGPDGLILVFKVIERPVVQNVEFRGNKAIKTKELQARTGLRKGSPFDVAANREAARRLEEFYRKDKGHAFATVELVKGGAQQDREVVFEISEGPKVLVTRTKFDGNDDISDAVLALKLRTKKAVLAIVGGKYDPATIPDDITALKQYYHALGYFDVQIEEQVTFHKPLIPMPFIKNRSHAHIEYIVDEGTRYKIDNVGFQIAGNNIFTEEQLRDGLELTSGEFFNARELNQDVDRIKDKYGELGRLFAKVEAVPVYREDQAGVADLMYYIDEDKPYRFRRVDVKILGDNPHTKRTVVYNRMRGMRPGHLASSNDIDRTKRYLGGTEIFDRGPQGGPRIELSRVPDNELASYQQAFRGQDDANMPAPISAGPDRRTELSADWQAAPAQGGAGDRPLDPHALAIPSSGATPPGHPLEMGGEFSDPHQPYQWVAPSESEPVYFRAQNFGGPPFQQPQSPLFDNSPQGDPLDRAIRMDNEGLLDATIYLQEARTGRLMFGVGVNSDAGVVGSIVLSETNFDILRPPLSWQDIVEGTAWRGGGQRFRLEAVPGSVVSRYLVNWADPYFLDTDYSLAVSGFYYNRFFEDWDEERGGGRVSVGRQWTPLFSTSAAVRLEDVNISDPDVPTPQILLDALGDNFLSTARVSAVHDTRDSAFLPGEGHRIELGYEQAFGDFDYPRAELDAKQYFTLYSRPDGGGRHILSVGGQLGWTDVDTPIFERFFAGGFQTFRGFDFRGVGPVQGPVRIGGRWLVLGSVEYMFPLLANEMIQGVVFTDFGTIENDIGLDEFRVSVGGGLRITVPAMGPVPLAFDWAVPIVDEDFDDTRIFSFYVGLNR